MMRNFFSPLPRAIIDRMYIAVHNDQFQMHFFFVRELHCLSKKKEIAQVKEK